MAIETLQFGFRGPVLVDREKTTWVINCLFQLTQWKRQVGRRPQLPYPSEDSLHEEKVCAPLVPVSHIYKAITENVCTPTYQEYVLQADLQLSKGYFFLPYLEFGYI